jgi:hypothetical protein
MNFDPGGETAPAGPRGEMDFLAGSGVDLGKWVK